MSEITVNGTAVFYVEDGPAAAPALLCSPSMWFDHQMFRELAAHFSDRYRVIRIDNRGQGQSQRHPRELLDFDIQTEDMSQLITALGLRDVTFVGNSMGGFIGLRLAARHGDQLASLLVMGTSAEADERDLDELADAIAAQGTEPFLDELVGYMVGTTTLTDPSRADILAEACETIRGCGPDYADSVWHIGRRPSIVDELGAITVPVTIVAGTEDPSYSVDYSERIAAGIPHSELVVMERIGHVHALENPVRVNEVLETHLARAFG